MCDIFSPACFIKMAKDFVLEHNKLPQKAVLATHHIEELALFTYETTVGYKNEIPESGIYKTITSFFGIPIEIGNDLTIAHME